MRLFFASLFLSLLSGCASTNWVVVDETDTATIYIDPTTISKEGNLRKTWSLVNYKKCGRDGVMSTRLRTEYDCEGESSRAIGVSTHSGSMATGEILVSGQTKYSSPTAVTPGTPSAAILKIACANK